MMVEVRAEEKDVVVILDSKVPVKRCMYYFRQGYGDEGMAVILARHFDKLLRSCVSEAREEAYNDGWADAKSKRRREQCFSGVL